MMMRTETICIHPGVRSTPKSISQEILRLRRVSFKRVWDGGAMGSRTPDLLIANETLYQLSYDPIQFDTKHRIKSGRNSTFASNLYITADENAILHFSLLC